MLSNIVGSDIRLILAILFVFLNGVAARGQQMSSLSFEQLTKEQGLSQNSGHAILQDSQGYLWFGTDNGLNKYNGYEMTIFQHDPEDSTTISGNNISTLYEDSQGNLWVGTTGAGINRFNRDLHSFTYFKVEYDSSGKVSNGSLSHPSVSSILELNNGLFWVGTDHGLNLLDTETGTFTSYLADSTTESLSSNKINILFQDSQNRFLIGTDKGLNIWNPQQDSFSLFPGSSEKNLLKGKNITEIYEDKQGTLWFGTSDGLYSYESQSGHMRSFKADYTDPGSISGNSILSILEDSRGVLWVGTENNGLNAYNRRTGEFYTYSSDLDDPSSISNNGIYSLYESRDQILWIGTYAGGINYLDRKKSKFEHYKYESQLEHPLSTNSVTSFLEDRQGNFWVGTDGGGLNRFNRETGNFYTMRYDPENSNSLASDVVLALLEDNQGYIWIGYYHGGLSRFDPESNTFKHYRHKQGDPNSLCHEDVFALYEDRQHKIWVGTNGGGVCRLNQHTGEFTHYQAEEGVIRDIMEDSRGNLWLATYGGGLKLLNQKEGSVWNFYEGDNGLRSNVLLAIHEDQKNRFWVGTKEGGLHRFDRDSLKFTSYNRGDGLPSNEVKGILEDSNGNLWLSTNNGISKFDSETKEILNFSVEDGLQGQEFNTLAYYEDRSGYMYFGGTNGFNRFHPDSVGITTQQYPVVLSDFKIFNRSVSIGKNSTLQKHISQTERITLPYTASVLTFEFAALNFNRIKGIDYAYKLVGFDENWNNVGNRRTATYTNLNPGEYRFQVKVTNDDGVWNDDFREVALVITPPFWQTSWFYMFSGIAIAGVIYLGYRWKVRRIRHHNEQLEEMVSARTSELNRKNQDLEDALQELQKARNELVDKAHKAGMADIATGVLHNVGNILNSVNTSAAVIQETARKSKLSGFLKANDILEENMENIEAFVANDPKGKQLLSYYIKLGKPLKKEREKILAQSRRLNEKINLINEVIAAQQSHAGAKIQADRTSLEEMIDSALTLQSGSIERHGLVTKKDLQATDPVIAHRTQLIHILVNLFKNAKEAMAKNAPAEKIITIKTWQEDQKIYLSVSDNGAGIKKEHLNKVFTQGFTTKNKGHGFGLHSCANYMQGMGGKIKVESEGEGKGATFTLVFPSSLKKDQKEPQLT